MSIWCPQASEQVNRINWKFHGGLHGSEHTSNFGVSEFVRKIIDAINNRVDNCLNADADDHDDAEDGRFLFEWEVVFVNKPLQAQFYRPHYHYNCK